MNYKNMKKAELLDVIRKLETLCNQQKKVIKHDKKLEKQSGQWLFLFDTDDVSIGYIDNIERKTTVLRHTTVIFDNRIVSCQVRLFPDGNRVDIVHTANRHDNLQHKYRLSFYKKVSGVNLYNETISQ